MVAEASPSGAFFAREADDLRDEVCRLFFGGEGSLEDSSSGAVCVREVDGWGLLFFGGEVSLEVSSWVRFTTEVVVVNEVVGVNVFGPGSGLGWVRIMRRSICRSRRLVSCSKKVRRHVVRIARTRWRS